MTTSNEMLEDIATLRHIQQRWISETTAATSAIDRALQAMRAACGQQLLTEALER